MARRALIHSENWGTRLLNALTGNAAVLPSHYLPANTQQRYTLILIFSGLLSFFFVQLLSCLTAKGAEALAHYEAGEMAAAANLMEWDSNSTEPDKKETTWNALHLLQTAHNNLLRVALLNAKNPDEPAQNLADSSP